MDEQKLRFTVKIADVPIGIVCRYGCNLAFFRDYLTDEAPRFTIEPAKADLDRLEASFRRSAELEGDPERVFSKGSIENGAIHELAAEALASCGVLLMHGSCISMDGQAYIFTAPSGTGKSTHTRLWREVFGERCFMLDDDKPMLRVEDSGVTVYGTPWNGKHKLGKNASAPLKAIINLSRGEVNRIEPISKAEAFTVLMRQAYTSPDPRTMAEILKLENTVLSSVGFWSLSCNTDPEAARVAYEGMNHRSCMLSRY